MIQPAMPILVETTNTKIRKYCLLIEVSHFRDDHQIKHGCWLPMFAGYEHPCTLHNGYVNRAMVGLMSERVDSLV